MGTMLAPVLETDRGEEFVQPPADLTPGEKGRQSDVFGDGKGRQEAEVLKDKAELLAAQLSSSPLREGLDGGAKEP